MQLKINGELKEVNDACSVYQLTQQLDLADKRIAVEINGEIVPRSLFHEKILTANDCIEIVQAIGGG